MVILSRSCKLLGNGLEAAKLSLIPDYKSVALGSNPAVGKQPNQLFILP